MKHSNRMKGTLSETATAARSGDDRASRFGCCSASVVIAIVSLALAVGCGKDDESAEPATPVEPQAAEAPVDESGSNEEEWAFVDELSDEGAEQQAESDPDSGDEPPATADESPRAWDANEIRAIRSRMGIASPPPLDLNSALRRADVREYFGYRGALPEAPLAGTAVGPDHNAIRYATEDGYGFGLEVWTFPTVSQGQAFYNELSSSLFVSEPFRRPGVDATISLFAGIRQLLAFREATPMVISITCQSDSCDPGQMARLLSRVLRRL